MSITNKASYDLLDLGSGQPISVPMEVIDVEMTSDNLFGSYAKAFVNEAYRVNPLLAERLQLTVEELESYIDFLLYQRILTVQGDCPLYRKLKVLYIPSWIQYNLSLVGMVTLRDVGLRIIPTMDKSRVKIDYEQAVAISEKIGSLENDLQIVQDAMPRSPEGNVDVMSTAMIAGYVRALKKVDHVAATYVTRFLGMKLKQEAAMQVLYRIQYDDIGFIASVLTTQKGLF